MVRDLLFLLESYCHPISDLSVSTFNSKRILPEAAALKSVLSAKINNNAKLNRSQSPHKALKNSVHRVHLFGIEKFHSDLRSQKIPRLARKLQHPSIRADRIMERLGEGGVTISPRCSSWEPFFVFHRRRYSIHVGT